MEKRWKMLEIDVKQNLLKKDDNDKIVKRQSKT